MLVLILLVFAAICIICVNAFYRKTTYYHVTGNSLIKILFDTGLWGEYLTYRKLAYMEKQGAKFLFNCYLPKDDGKTTEIDVLMIHMSGIYVFESKNYSGWIFGNERYKTWTQSLPQGKGKKALKEHFLNPIMQNKLHIQWLNRYIENESFPVHSIVVFSERCTLKKVETYSDTVSVIKRDDVSSVVKRISEQNKETVSTADVERIYQLMYPTSQVSEEVKKKHIDDIQNEIGKE